MVIYNQENEDKCMITLTMRTRQYIQLNPEWGVKFDVKWWSIVQSLCTPVWRERAGGGEKKGERKRGREGEKEREKENLSLFFFVFLFFIFCHPLPRFLWFSLVSHFYRLPWFTFVFVHFSLFHFLSSSFASSSYLSPLASQTCHTNSQKLIHCLSLSLSRSRGVSPSSSRVQWTPQLMLQGLIIKLSQLVSPTRAQTLLSPSPNKTCPKICFKTYFFLFFWSGMTPV